MSRSLSAVKLLTCAGILALCVVLGSTVLFPESPGERLSRLAEQYVQLALSLDTLHQGEVDHYYWPETLVAADADSLTELQNRITDLQADLAAIDDPVAGERQQALADRMAQLDQVIEFLHNEDAYSFTQEANLLYQVQLPELQAKTRLDDQGRVVIIERPASDEELRREAILEELNALLPGRGSLPFRVARFQSQFQVPLDRREEVFLQALSACQEITQEYWSLPNDAGIQIEWTRSLTAPWHQYQGNGSSLLQLNPLTLSYMGSMLDIACHEGYPGHHAQFLLQESNADSSAENMLVLLRSPESALLEGAANFGAALALTPERRLQVERDVLFPLAGLPTDDIELYLTVHKLKSELDTFMLTTLQEYGDKRLPRTATLVELENDHLVGSPAALLDFIDQYGAYTVGYTLAEKKLYDYLQRHSAPGKELQTQWRLLSEILSAPARYTGEIFGSN